MLRKTSEEGFSEHKFDGTPELRRKPVASEPFIPEPLLDTLTRQPRSCEYILRLFSVTQGRA
jgi:hypothetical protein